MNFRGMHTINQLIRILNFFNIDSHLGLWSQF